MGIPAVLAAAAGGALTLAKVGDAHTYGKIKGDIYAQNGDANGLARTFLNSQTMQQPDGIADGARKWLFKADMDHNIRQPFHFIGGYVKGFFTSLANNIIPLALGVGTIFAGFAGKGARNAVKDAQKALAGGTGTAAAVTTAQNNLTNTIARWKGPRIGLAIACGAVMLGTAIAALAGTKRKTEFDNQNYK